MSAGARKYTWPMILSFGSGTAATLPALPIALTLASAVALAAYLVAASPLIGRGGGFRAALLVGWVAQAAAIAMDVSGFGAAESGARFGFAPALSATAWLVLAVYLVESRFVPIVGARRALALFGAAAVVLAWLFPGVMRPHVAPAWAPLHWLLGIASYGLFGAALLHAALQRRAERALRLRSADVAATAEGSMPLLQIERLTFRFVCAGFVLLSATLLLGVAHPEPLHWDHKAVFSVLSWAVFAALLAGRRLLGWRGQQAARWLYAGAAMLLLAYVGSRFVLEVVLHRGPVAG